MIGTTEEAEFIHGWYHAVREQYDYESAPLGWRYLGEGCYRTAFLAPSGVVYKVQQNTIDSWQSNLGEWEQWKRLRLECRMPRHTRLPWMFYHPIANGDDLGVIAVEKFDRSLSSVNRYNYAEKGDLDYWSLLAEVRAATRVGDLYSSNLMIDEVNKLLVPTDLGCDGS